MKWSHLKPGLRLELTPILSGGMPAFMREQLVSQLLQSVNDPERIMAAVPIHMARHVTWPTGSRLRVSFTEPARGAWHFNARILDVQMIDRISCYVLRAETELHRLQRRAHFRVRCAIDVTLTLQSSDQIVHAVTCDIGGGGVCLLTSQLLPTGMPVRISFSIGPGRLFTVNSRVVRHEPVRIGHFQRYRVSLQYIDIRQDDQDSLIRFLMNRQKHQKSVES